MRLPSLVSFNFGIGIIYFLKTNAIAYTGFKQI